MQSAVLPLLLLPAALAALCPCPSPSPEDTVCGSDGRTYASLCELQCAKQTGLSAAHPGPCNTTVVASRRRRYAVEYPEWDKCITDRQCVAPHDGNCSECGAGDETCRVMCAWNCLCGCAGLPTGGLDGDTHYRWWKCDRERKCTESKRDECDKNCDKNCDNEFCRDLCHMEWIRCSCGCGQHVVDTRTSTTAAPTTSTTTPPTSTTTAPTTSTTTAPTSTTAAPTTSTTAAPTTSTTTAPTTSTTAAPTTSTTTATTASSSPSTTEAVISATEVETNSTQAVTSSSGTTATVAWTWRNYMGCVEQSRDCGRDSLLPDVRRANCTCGCMGLPGGDLEAYDGSAAVQTCLADCGGLLCKKRCQKDECHDNCHLRELRCRCECNHRARARATAAASTDTKLKN